MRGMKKASELVGATPSAQVRPVSLALRRAVATFDALAPSLPIVVGCSGGADSLALATCLIDAGSRAGHDVYTITVDHGIRPESTAEAEEVVRKLTWLGADKAVREQVQVGSAGGPEAAARDARYEGLARAAAELSAAGAPIWLGHTLDDQAEGVLLSLARGSGTHSLAGMRQGFEGGHVHSRIRPLLGLRRADTEACCNGLGLQYVVDPSNKADGPWKTADGQALRRAALRERALPALAQALGKDAAPALAKSALLARQDDEALEAMAQTILAEVATDEDGQILLQANALASHLPALRRRVLRLAGARVGLTELTATHLQALDALVSNWHGQGPVDLPAGQALREAKTGRMWLRATSER